MTINYSFKITSINRLVLYIDEEGNRYDNLITKINYYYQGIDENQTIAIYNSSIELDRPTSTNYKAYNTLVESDLINWIESLISPDDITLMKTVISNNISDINTKTSSLPWITT
jgi:hypothetical protein